MQHPPSLLPDPVALRRRLAADPQDAASAHDLALLVAGSGDLAQSLRRFDRALALRPGDAVAHHNRAEVLARTGRPEAAASGFATAVRLDPGFIAARIGAATLALRHGRFEAAEAALRRAAALAPGDAAVLNNLGNAVRSQIAAARALPFYDRALAVDPAQPEARWNRGLARLARHDFGRGFADFEARWRLPGRAPLPRPDRAWDGTAAPDLDLLVVAEQGYGDTLQFVRFLPEARRRVGRLRLLCQPGLGRLLAAAFPDIEVTEGTAAATDAARHVSLLSLPHVLGRDPSMPARYLRPSAAAAARAFRLDPADGLRIGLCWAGSGRANDLDGAASDLRRSFAAEDLAPLAGIGGVRFASLQFGRPAPAWMADAMAGVRDFDDTAAAIDGLDLVVTVDTAVAHLAAALGRPTWVVPRPDSCWRWQEEGRETTWYPTVRLYRTRGAFDPAGVVAEIAADLTRLVASR